MSSIRTKGYRIYKWKIINCNSYHEVFGWLRFHRKFQLLRLQSIIWFEL